MPLFSVQVLDNIALSAGHGSSFYDEYETREVFTDKNYLYDMATWITGHSMEPVYQEGEVVLIRELRRSSLCGGMEWTTLHQESVS